MKRFYFDDEEHEEDDDNLDDMMMFPGPSEFITMGQFDNPNHFLLSNSIKICESYFFWRFLSSYKKIDMIKEVFERLAEITEKEKDA